MSAKSRFFHNGNDSSSESSSDEEELYSEEEEEEEGDKDEDESEEGEGGGADSDGSDSDVEVGKKKGASAFLVDVSSESEESEDEGTTRVKSAKDKRFDELDATITIITNGQKINDWGSISQVCVHDGPERADERGRLTGQHTQSSTNSTARWTR